MTIGTPVSLGKVSGTSTSASSIALTAAAAIQAGDLVVVLIGYNSSTSGKCSGISDGTNTYTKIDAVAEGTSPSGGELWYCANCAAVASPTITATLSSSLNWRIMAAARVSGTATTPLDQHTATASATASPSVTTAALAQADEIVFGGVYMDASATITTASGYSRIVADSGAGVNFELAYKIVSATTAVTYAPTNSPSAGVAIFIATFKGVPVTSGTLSATGSSAVSFAGIAIVAASLSAVGSATISESGGGITASSLSVSGSALASFAGDRVLTGALSAAGAATVAASGSSVLTGVLSISGAATASFGTELRQVISTNMLQKPVDYALAGDQKDFKRGRAPGSALKNIFRE